MQHFYFSTNNPQLSSELMTINKKKKDKEKEKLLLLLLEVGCIYYSMACLKGDIFYIKTM
jgi:hypothetical protein